MTGFLVITFITFIIAFVITVSIFNKDKKKKK